MKTEEFNLSDCLIDNQFTIKNYNEEIIVKSKIKEFIRLLESQISF